MSANSKIEWTDHTFNPWEGCQKVGPGCDHCYAETRNARFGGGQAINWGPGAPRRRTSAANWNMPLRWNAQHDAFMVQHGRRQRVFCASLADVFDNEVDPQWRVDLFNLILSTPNLDWLLLTKRIGNAARMIEDTLPASMKAPPADHPLAWPWPNVWIGATVVNQAEADRDIPKLLAVPAARRFLSMEPLLGPVDLGAWIGDESCHVCSSRFYGDEMNLKPGGVQTVNFEDQPEDEENIRRVCPTCGTVDIVGEVGEVDEEERGGGLHWVIVGGESGPGARPMHPDWARSLRDQCQAAGVPFMFKQWGEWLPGENEQHPEVQELNGSPRRVAHHQDGRWGSTTTKINERNYVTWDDAGTMRAGEVYCRWRVVAWAERVGKKAAGRLLDGRTWDEVPI